MQNHANNAYALRLAQQALTPEEHKVEPRTYFHAHNYAKFHIQLAVGQVKTIAFANHRYITDDKREQDQLDMVADQPGTFIYTIADSDVAHAMQQELRNEQQQQVMQAAQARAEGAGQHFDARVPIVPVNSAAPQGIAVVGMQNSLSGSTAAPDMTLEVGSQVTAPDARALAVKRLQEMTAKTKAEGAATGSKV